jgi:hypothetical protein
MKRVLLIATSLLTLLTACSRASNYEQASFAKKDGKYLVELRGKRRLMAHDPISGIRNGTYEDSLILRLPRIEGVIDGTEIPVRRGDLSYEGRVDITKDKMKVDLYYVESSKHPLLWNDEYTLVEKDTIEIKEP